MVVLVCGGRAVKNSRLVFGFLDFISGKLGMSTMVSGAAKGADSLAERWAILRKIPTKLFPAKWDQYGKSAGYIRNEQMIKEGCPDFVIAFPGGSGTAHMIATALHAGLPVLRVPENWTQYK